MPPPSLSISTITSFRPSRDAASRPPTSWASATSPISRTIGPRRRGRRRRRWTRCRRSRSRRGWTAPGRAFRGPGRTSRRRGPASTRRRRTSLPAGSRVPSSAATRGSFRPAGPTTSAIAPRGGRSAACQPSSQLVSLRRLGSFRRARPAVARGSAAMIVPTTPAGSCHAASGSRLDLQGVEPAEPRPQRLRRRKVADAEHEVGSVGGGPAAVAQQRVVVRDRRRAAPGARQRLGQQREPGALGERRDRLPEPGIALRPAGHHHRPGPRAQLVRERRRAAVGRLGADPRARDPRPPALAPGHDLDVGHSVGAVRHQRLTQREVQVDGPGAPFDRRPERAAGELAQPAHPRGRRRVVVDLEVPLGRAAEQLDLIDRLPGADVAQLRRAVGGEHDQRHARLVGLDHRRRVVRGCGAGGAGQRGRHAGRLRQPQREERGAALVQMRRSRAAAGRAPASARAASNASPARCTRRAGRSARVRRRRHAGRDRCRFRA